MRPDLNKVLTERPRRGSSSRNLKTRWHENGYDDRDKAEDKYALPKIGKMKMHNRENGSETKEFSDLLGPLHRWIKAQVGRNWDKVYSEIRQVFPNSNKQNHHLIDTHLMGYINRNCFIEKVGKVNKVFEHYAYGGAKHGDDGKRELGHDDVYVDPVTNVLRLYKKNKRTKYKDKEPKKTLTGYLMYSTESLKYRYKNMPTDQEIEDKKYYIYLSPTSKIIFQGNSWVRQDIVKTISPAHTDPKTGFYYRENEHTVYKYHSLSKKELIQYGLKKK